MESQQRKRVIRQRKLDDMNEDIVGTYQGATLTEEQKSTQERFKRVQAKLDGTDFDPKETLSVNDQVDRLIYEAQNIENLCQHYTGWCIHW